MAHIKAKCALLGLLDLCKMSPVVAKEVKADDEIYNLDTSSPPERTC